MGCGASPRPNRGWPPLVYLQRSGMRGAQTIAERVEKKPLMATAERLSRVIGLLEEVIRAEPDARGQATESRGL